MAMWKCNGCEGEPPECWCYMSPIRQALRYTELGDEEEDKETESSGDDIAEVQEKNNKEQD